MKKVLLILLFVLASVTMMYSQARPSITFYNPNRTYLVNDLVTVDGIIYRCLTTISGTTPPNATYWVEASGGGGGGLSSVSADPTPLLGGNLGLNGYNITGTGNISITGNLTLSGGSYIGSGANISAGTINESALNIQNAPVDEYSLTYESSTGNFEWQLISGGGGAGDVVKVGTPLNNQIAVWTGDGTLEGESALTFTPGSPGTLGIQADVNLSGNDLNNVAAIGNVSSTELEILDGAILSTTELNYVDGATSNIQNQLNAKANTASPTFTGTVSGISKDMVGLGSVDNTADADKPISTATQTELDLKETIAQRTRYYSTPGQYTTTLSDDGKKVYLEAGVTGVNLDDTGITVNFQQTLYNDTGGPLTITLIGGTDTTEQTLIPIPDVAYAYIELKEANTWSVIIGAVGSGTSESTAVGDTSEIDLTLTGTTITADIIASSIDESKLDVSTNASLDLADSSLQTTSVDTSAELAAIVTDETGTGSIVFSNSPTLVTPNLGTPTSINLIAGTGLPIGSGVSGLGTGMATFLNGGTSSQLAGAVTNETGTGSLVFANSPTLVTPNLGTPSAIVLSAGTGLPAATGISGLATGMSSFFTGGTSASLAGALSNETGSGSAVFATSPTLVTPNLGTPSAINLVSGTNLPLATGVTGILPVANGGTGRATGVLANALVATGTTATGAQVSLSQGTSGQILRSNGTGSVPSWTNGLPATTTPTTVLTLNNPGGNYANMGVANSTTTYTTTGAVLGGWTKVLINTTSEPTVTGATKIAGATWVTGTNMYMVVSYNGTATQFYFLEI